MGPFGWGGDRWLSGELARCGSHPTIPTTITTLPADPGRGLQHGQDLMPTVGSPD